MEPLAALQGVEANKEVQEGISKKPGMLFKHAIFFASLITICCLFLLYFYCIFYCIFIVFF